MTLSTLLFYLDESATTTTPDYTPIIFGSILTLVSGFLLLFAKAVLDHINKKTELDKAQLVELRKAYYDWYLCVWNVAVVFRTIGTSLKERTTLDHDRMIADNHANSVALQKVQLTLLLLEPDDSLVARITSIVKTEDLESIMVDPLGPIPKTAPAAKKALSKVHKEMKDKSELAFALFKRITTELNSIRDHMRKRSSLR